MKDFWKSFLRSVVALCLVGCSIGNRNTHSKSNVKECSDDPTMPWCASMKDLCDQKNMDKMCAKTCNLCPSQNSTDCTSLNCEHSCSHNDEDDPKCVCNTGYELLEDGRTCQDIDECARENPCPGDRYDCINTKGSYRCEGRCPSNQYKYYKLNKCCESAKGDVCGLNSENGGPRAGGAKGMVTRWPWMTLISFESSSRRCAGILVDSSWVLTAAHCVDRKKPRDVKMVFGIVSIDFRPRINKGLQRRVAEMIYVHPNFKHPYNDVALIKLNKDVEFNDFVRPNCLPHGEDPVASQNCWALGYASELARFSQLRLVLHQETVTVSNPEKCLGHQASTNGYDMMCISHESPQLPEDCQGSTGGPLVCQRCSSCGWYVAGFASQGESCRFRGKSTSNFTKTSEHELWIRKTMGLAGLRSAIQPSCKPPRKFSDWSSWGSWSGCSVTCGNGSSHQRRVCRGIERGTNGCRGDKKRTRVCQRQSCKPECTEWTSWSTCSVTCGAGSQRRSRECNFRSAQRTETERLCRSAPCQPVWSKWADWSRCSVSCGGGVQSRERHCGRIFAGRCVGSSISTKPCNQFECPANDWSDWSSWSKCDVTCGTGLQTRRRKCRHRRCAGPDTERKMCSGESCITNDKCDGYTDGWPVYCHNVAYCGDVNFWAHCGQTCCQEIRKRGLLLLSKLMIYLAK